MFPAKIQKSNDGTILMKFKQGHSSVIIPTKNDKNSLCVSCQIGCSCNCEICHTGKFVRDLTKEEIIDQFIEAKKLVDNITSVVFMGMGEPTLNFNNVKDSIEELNKEYGISKKKITISSIGRDYDKLKELDCNIAISLHSGFDNLRKDILPVASTVQEVVDFAKEFKDRKPGVMIAYAIIEGINDSEEDLQKLLSYDWPENVNFNLIEFNPIHDLIPSLPETMESFKKGIIEAGYKCFIRESRGADIGAACGMLDFS